MPKGERSKFLHAGGFETDAGWHLKAHLHSFHEIITVLRGEHHVIIEKREIVALPGDVLFYPSGVAHEEWAGSDTPFEIAFVSFEWSGCDDSTPSRVRDSRGRIRDMVRWLREESDAYHPTAPVLRERLLAAILAEFLRAASARTHNVVDVVRSFVRENLARPIALEDLASISGLSRYHFLRTYKSLTGRTPMSEVRRIRLESARNLLMTSDLPLKQIAPLVGMESEYHLCRLLRRHFGLGARELRRRVAAGD